MLTTGHQTSPSTARHGSTSHETIMQIELEFGSERVGIGYDTLDECLSDIGLQALFNDGLITKCTVYCGDKRITGLPLMDWDRLQERVVSSSTAILHWGAALQEVAA